MPTGSWNSILITKNVSFDHTADPPYLGEITADGQLLIGYIGQDPNIAMKAGDLISNDGTVSITYIAPDLDLSAGDTVATKYNADSGFAIPASNQLNINGRSGSRTSASGSTVIVNSPYYSDQAASTTVLKNTGSFATNAITLTLPATGDLEDGALCEFVATNGVLVIQCNGTQVAHLANASTSAGGTITSTGDGDSICLRYQVSTNDWWATSSMGVFVLA